MLPPPDIGTQGNPGSGGQNGRCWGWWFAALQREHWRQGEPFLAVCSLLLRAICPTRGWAEVLLQVLARAIAVPGLSPRALPCCPCSDIPGLWRTITAWALEQKSLLRPDVHAKPNSSLPGTLLGIILVGVQHLFPELQQHGGTLGPSRRAWPCSASCTAPQMRGPTWSRSRACPPSRISTLHLRD